MNRKNSVGYFRTKMSVLRNYSQHFAALSASVLAAVGGTIVAWTTPVLPKLNSEIPPPLGKPISNAEAALITSILLLGSTVGNLFVGPFVNYVGRKRTLLYCSVPMFLLWIATYFVATVEVLYAVRFFMGFLGAFPIGAIVIYISEITEPESRGKLGLFCMFMMEIGQLIVTAVGSYVSYKTLSLVCASLPVIFFASFYWAPESPYYYLRKNDLYNAEKSLRRVRKGSVTKELAEISKNVHEDMAKQTTVKELLTTAEYRQELLIMIGLKSLHQMSGNTAIQAYMGIIFQLAATGFDSAMSTIICTAVSIPALLFSFGIVDKFGRKPLYYVSTIGCTVSLLLEFTYFFLQHTLEVKMDKLTWLPLSGIFLFYIFRSLGVTTLSPLLLGELFPTNVKGAAVSICLFYGSVLAFLVSLGFPLLVSWWGISYTFLLFSICCFLGFIFVLFFLPETKGKSLAQIQIDIRKHSKSYEVSKL